MPDATLAASFRPTTMQTVGRIRRLRRIRHFSLKSNQQRQPADNHTRHCHIAPVSHKAFAGNALRNIISAANSPPGASSTMPAPERFPCCQHHRLYNWNFCRRGNDKQAPATAIATTHIRLLSTAPSAWGITRRERHPTPVLQGCKPGRTPEKRP